MINWDRVEELHEEIGPEDFSSVVDLFLEEVGQSVGQLGESATPPKLAETLHILKGCALNLGFNSFSLVCQKGETLILEGNEGQVEIPELISSYEASLKEFHEGMERRFA
jgi:HPt (histidine-containing phosphotransfer) domain-containing protein